MGSIQQTLTAGTDKSGTIATGGTSQPLAAANTSRKRLVVQNVSDTAMTVTDLLSTATAGGAGCWLIAVGATWEATTNRAVYIVCATTGKKFTAVEI